MSISSVPAIQDAQGSALSASPPVLIHIGYSRTGTTWLQKFLFNRGVGPFWSLEEDKKFFIHRIIRPNNLGFDPAPLRRHYAKVVAEEMLPGRLPVVSNERFSGTVLSGGFDTKDIADRLHAIFPDARVLICVREQKDMIRSSYNNYLNAGGSCRLETFLEPPRRPYRLPHFDYDYFAYDALASYYRQLFGADRVLLLPCELFRKAPGDYMLRILSFCGYSEALTLPFDRKMKSSLSPFFYPLIRRLNPFIKDDPANGFSGWADSRLEPYFMRPIAKLDAHLPKSWRRRATEKLMARIRERVGDRYAESNRRLQSMTEIGLESLGYHLAPGSQAPPQ
jgi:hypothetical protein